MESLGFKTITHKNWNEPDETTVVVTCPIDYDKNSGCPPYLEQILQPQLDMTVPLEIRRLFEVARGAMVYSYYFYPMYTLAANQLFRIGETALLLKAKNIGHSKNKSTFSELLKFLRENDVLDDGTLRNWENLRKLRNIASHPHDQNIFSPSMALDILNFVVEDINTLFTKNLQQ